MSVLLSIITINYNEKDNLRATLDSVFKQDFKDFEFVVVDGGSIDGSRALLENCAPKIDYWVSEPDNGIYHAMNKGIKAARGEYLLFLNGGDEFLHSSSLKEAWERIGTDRQDIIYFDIKYEMSYGRCRINTFPVHPTLAFLYTGYLPHQATFIKRALFADNKVGLYDETHPIASDWKFFVLAIFKHQATYQYIPYTLSFFRYGGKSTAINKQQQAAIRAWRESVLAQHFPEQFAAIKSAAVRDRKIKLYSGYYLIYKMLKFGRYGLYKLSRGKV